MKMAELDDLVAAVGLPVRAETLAEAWDMTAVAESSGLPAGQVLALITMRAGTGMDERLGEAAREFVRATSATIGSISTTLHRSSNDPRTWFLIERFDGEAAFSTHMASDYFRKFQEVQRTLLAEPVRATFLARGT
jgi:quinol monooxygenase YgiN